MFFGPQAMLQANGLSDPNLIHTGQRMYQPGYPSPSYPPLVPGPGTSGNVIRRVERLERRFARLENEVERLERRVRRLESQMDLLPR